MQSSPNRTSIQPIRKAIGHIVEQPFIFATGLAALAHSTWSLGTLFAGKEPEQFTLAWFAWFIPAFLIAFALDVGQIATSAEIRAGERTRAKYATFATFAIATYYLQWLYIAHHMPALQLGAGVSALHAGFATTLRDFAIYLIPALLPLSTLLYTFSHSHIENAHPSQDANALPTIQVSQQVAVIAPQPAQNASQVASPEPRALPETQNAMLPANADAQPLLLEPEQPENAEGGEMHVVECICGKRIVKDTARKAQNALTAHQRFCEVYANAKVEQ